MKEYKNIEFFHNFCGLSLFVSADIEEFKEGNRVQNIITRLDVFHANKELDIDQAYERHTYTDFSKGCHFQPLQDTLEDLAIEKKHDIPIGEVAFVQN